MSLLKTPGNRALRPHLFSALLISLLGHGLLLLGGRLRLPSPPPPVMQVELRPAEMPAPEPLLKNTLETAEPIKEKPATTPPAKANKGTSTPSAKRSPPTKLSVEAAQRKLAKHLYYPPQAVAAGLEGEVRLLLSLDPTGRITDADIAASSGHAILDQAALRAAWVMGSIEGADKKEMILPVVFRLR